MQVKQLLDIEGVKLIVPATDDKAEFGWVYACDMLSAVMAKAGAKDLWVTIQTHKNIVGVAVIKEIPAIMIAEGLVPDADTLDKAREEGIAVLSSPDSVFEISGKIYQLIKS